MPKEQDIIYVPEPYKNIQSAEWHAEYAFFFL